MATLAPLHGQESQTFVPRLFVSEGFHGKNHYKSRAADLGFGGMLIFRQGTDLLGDAECYIGCTTRYEVLVWRREILFHGSFLNGSLGSYGCAVLCHG